MDANPQAAQSGQHRTVWARQVASALEKKLNASDSPFYWAKASEDILLKDPTCVWPQDPFLVYQVNQGSNEGIFVEVHHCGEDGKVQQLLVAKFLTGMRCAGKCLDLVVDFCEGFDPKQLVTA